MAKLWERKANPMGLRELGFKGLTEILKQITKKGVKAKKPSVRARRRSLKGPRKFEPIAGAGSRQPGRKIGEGVPTAGKGRATVKKITPPIKKITPPIKKITPPIKAKPKVSRTQGRKKPSSTAVTTTQSTPVAKKPGTSLVPIGSSSRAVTGGGTKVGNTMKPATRTTPKQITNKSGTKTPPPKTKNNNLRNLGIGAGIIAAGVTADKLLKNNKGAEAKPYTPKSREGGPGSRPTPKKVTPKYQPGNAGPKRVAPKSKPISAGPNTGFGPKGNIFPGSPEERAGYMKMYGGTGSAAAKAAAAGKQGNLEAGRSAVAAAKKKRLSKPVERKAGGSVVARQVKGFGAARRPRK